MKKAQMTCFIIGIMLLISALSLCVYNIHEDQKGGEQAQLILEEIKAEIPESTETATEKKYDLFSEYETEPVFTEAVIAIDDAIYIGVICIPDLGIELPVMNEWSYPNLKIAPCRYKGSYLDHNMIIAAHNYRSHFGRIGELNSGSKIIFTDITGKDYIYEVNNIENINGTDIEAMDFGSAESWDLTLFTCTLSGQSRVTIRANQVEEREGK